jgi:homoserine kinase
MKFGELDNLIGNKVVVKVPATTANLGPGFDTLGLALSFYDELEVEAVDSNEISIKVLGEGEGEVPEDESNLIVKSLLQVFAELRLPVPGLKLTSHNYIPHGRGMGSSGAAVVAGVMAAKGLLSGIAEISSDQLLQFATKLEGHPDNVAPSLFGGLNIVWNDANGPKHKKLFVHRGVSPLVLVPKNKMSTELARSLQPSSVSHDDAVFNLSRSALLVAALTQSPELLLDATEDRLHQVYRGSAMPETVELIQALRAKGHAAVVSGAGPSVLVLSSDPGQRLEAARFSAQNYPHWRPLLLAVDFKGATVLEYR